MKKIILIAAALLLGTNIFAASNKKFKVKQIKLNNEKYIYDCADKLDVKDIIDDEVCYFGANEDSGTFVFYVKVIYQDGRFIYGLVNDGEKLVSKASFYDKKVDINQSFDTTMGEYDNLIEHAETSEYVLNDFGKKVYTTTIAYNRAEYCESYSEVKKYLPPIINKRNEEIMKNKQPATEEEMNDLIEILKKYNADRP